MNTKINPYNKNNNYIDFSNNIIEICKSDFTGIDPNTFNNSINTIDDVFYQKTNIINNNNLLQNEFSNNYNLIDNNLNENINKESEIVQNVFIHSLDRDINYYINPFSFIVSMDSKIAPNLGDVKLKRVKYIKMNYLIIPNSFVIDSTTSFSSSANNILTNLPSIIVKIKELDTNSNILSTGSNLDVNSFVFFFDASAGLYHSRWICKQYPFVYKTSSLFDLKKMDISIYDCNGNQILMTGINTADTNLSNFTHPLNNNIQLQIFMEIATIEIEMATKPKFK